MSHSSYCIGTMLLLMPTIHSALSERVWATFINEDSSPAMIDIQSGGNKISYQTSYKGSTVGPLSMSRDSLITIQGKGVDARTIPATIFETNHCCIITTVKAPNQNGALALSLQFGPHPSCPATFSD